MQRLASASAAGGAFTARVRVRNTGERAGTDVVQLYARDVVGSVTRPVAQLLAYRRVDLAPGQEAVVRFRVPTSRLAFTDVIADPSMDDATRADMEQWTGCIAGALTQAEFRAALEGAGLVDVDIQETHRVHEHAASAVIRAVRPAG